MPISTRLATSVLVTLVVVLAVAPAAQADTFCVLHAGCDDPAKNFTTIGAAILAADANDPMSPGEPIRDRILVGPGIFHETVDNGSDNPIDIVGSGPRAGTTGTRIERDPGNSLRTVTMGISFGGVPASTISDLTIAVPTGTGNTGLLAPGKVDNVAVVADADLTNGVGVSTNGNGPRTVLSRLDIDLPGVATGLQARLATVERSSIKAQKGINGEGLFVRTSTIDANLGAIGGLDLKLEDCVMHISGANGLGLWAPGVGVNASSRLKIRHVTMIGDSDPTSLAVRANSEAGPANSNFSEVDMRSSIVTGFAKNFQRSGNMVGGQTGTANLTVAYSNFDSSIPVDDNGGPGAFNATTPGGNISADPGFLSPTDLRLAFSSPLIDAGDPASPEDTDFPPESSVDLGGLPRKVDGDGDGVARADIGAFEFQQQAPQVTGATVAPLTVLTGRPVSFSGSGTDANGEPLTFRWDFGDGASAAGADATHSYSTAGTKTATFTVTDFHGLKATATRTVRVNAPPRVTSFSVKKRIRASRALPRLTRKRRGPTMSLRLSEDATATLSFARRLPSGRYRKVRKTVALRAKSGLNRVIFGGRLSRRRTLTPGAYRVTVVARDADGVRSAPRRARFRLLPPA